MDPPEMINDGAFQPASGAPYNLTEIWPFPINGGESGGGFDLRRVQFGQSLGQFAENANVNGEVSGNDAMVLDHRGAQSGGSRKRRDSAPENESAKIVSTTTGNGMTDCDGKRIRTGELRDQNPESKAEANLSKPAKQNTKVPEPPKQDYIHVRARRGQATDNHSLAERARREKINERMKILQDLVPGCNKVIGKAVVLDEIINYVQSLQRQVEFLSMKLETVNSRTNPGIEGFPSKDFGQQTFDTAGMVFGSQATTDYGRSSSSEWLHMQIGGDFERTT